MRLRHDPSATPLLEKDDNYVLQFKGKPFDIKTCFSNENNENCLEIGVGKGDFISQMALRNLKVNYIGIERYSSVLIYGLKKLQQNESLLNNVKLIHDDATKIMDFFLPSTFSRIYLNFSDPWPKKRHEKRRLTSLGFLRKYQSLLVSNGEIWLKTDNDDFFDYSQQTIKANPDWNLIFTTSNLYESEYLTNNISTEYETKFHKRGKNINMLIARKKS